MAVMESASSSAPRQERLADASWRAVSDYLRAALPLRDAGRFDEAEALLCEAVERFPGEARPRVEWAGLAHRRRNWAESARRCENLRATFPEEPAGYSIGAAALRELGRLDEVETVLAAALDLFPGNPGIANESAWAAVQRKNWPEALRRWQLVRDWFPDQPGGHTGMALALRELRRFDEAETVLAEVIQRYPSEAAPLIDYARIAEARGDWGEAAGRWKTMRERCPDNLAGYTEAGRALLMAADTAGAEALLAEAVARFPDDARAAVAWAEGASRRRDWNDAERRWAEVRRRFPDQAAGYVAGAGASRELDRLEEAEALLSAGAEKFPADPGVSIEHAWSAHRRRDWNEAVRRWEIVRERFPGHPSGYTGAAMSLREGQRFDEAEALLASALGRFPDDPAPLIENARVAERRRSWAAAAERWNQVRSRFPDRLEGYMGGALALSSEGRHDEAEQVLDSAITRFPDVAQIACEHAWVAYRQHRWDDAEQRFAQIRRRFPDEPSGYRGGAEVLISKGRLAEAEQLLAAGIERIPTDPHGAFVHALLPASPLQRGRRDWNAALARLETLCARFADFEHGHIAATRMLREQGRIEEAEAVASRGLQHCARSAELGIEYARVAQDKADWPEALRRYRMVTERHPDQVTGYVGLAGALLQLRRFDEAEALIQQTMSLFPANPEPFAEYAQLAMRRNEPAEAVRRWSEAASRFPHDAQLARKLFEARLRAADLDPESSLDAPAEASRAARPGAESGEALPDMRELVAVFESLGGTLLGCEFGLFQREFGAEPLGLLRWTDVEPDALVAALEAEFEGVGLPENTELLTPGDAEGEYTTRDRRFGMRMHTFVSSREVPPDRMFPQVCRRLQFLRDKLIADLRDGEKIFVYKITARNLAAAELVRIRAAMRHYGDNTLLYVRYADPAHPDGTVEIVEPGLLVGYVDRFAMSADEEHLGAATLSWTAICRAAYRLWRNTLASVGPAVRAEGRTQNSELDLASPTRADAGLVLSKPHDLVMQFESLGGSGHGCEFGIFQREFGAEPLGLLRWADLNPEALAGALESEFDGVGLPENTELFVPAVTEQPEYWTRDRRYWMAMRTFVPADDIAEDQMRERVCRRLQFLRRKLIEDLRAGNKIFVYKVLERNLTEKEIERICRAMRRYGDNTLLYVRYADAEHPFGTVERAAPGLMIGYIDRFSFSPEDVNLGPATQSWLRICENAYRVWAQT